MARCQDCGGGTEGSKYSFVCDGCKVVNEGLLRQEIRRQREASDLAFRALAQSVLSGGRARLVDNKEGMR